MQQRLGIAVGLNRAFKDQRARGLKRQAVFLMARHGAIKRIAGMKDDVVCAVGDAIFINGRLVADRLVNDELGRRLPRWGGCHLLNGDEVFLLMEGVANSFDGRYFGPVIGAGDATADKPDPAPIHLALAQFDRRADASIWYLGDTALDMEAARAAGVTAVLIGSADHDGGVERAAPHLHFATAHALLARLREIA